MEYLQMWREGGEMAATMRQKTEKKSWKDSLCAFAKEKVVFLAHAASFSIFSKCLRTKIFIFSEGSVTCEFAD